jgi:dCMP deaminase
MKPEQQQVYMQTAYLFATLSKAVRAKVGAVLVTETGVTISGVNGTPSGTDNNCENTRWNHLTKSHELVTKQEVIHAELNCILKAAKEGVSVTNSSLFVTLSPCLSCAAMIKQAGIRKVYFREQYRDNSGVQYLRDTGVEVSKI